VSDEVLGLIYQEGEMAELCRRGAEVDSAEHDEDEDESEGGVAEDVVGDGCHEGEKEGEQKLRMGVGSVFHIPGQSKYFKLRCTWTNGQANIRQVANIRRARVGLEDAGDFLEEKKRGWFVLPNLRLIYYKAPDLDITNNDSAASRHTISARRRIGRSASAFLNGSASHPTSPFRSPDDRPMND
jgi:hypothetical protein